MKIRFGNMWGMGTMLVCASALATAQQPPLDQDAAQSIPAPRIKLSTTTWDFGTVWQGEDAKTKVTITNTGTAPLELNVKSSCGCTVPSKPKSPLPPGESDIMTVHYDAVRRVGPARQSLTITTNDPDRPSVNLQIRGMVKPMYKLKPVTSLSFGRLYEDSAETRTIEISNRYDRKMNLKLKDGQDFGPYDVQLKALKEGEHYALSATTRTPLPVGPATTEVLLLTGFERLPEIRVIAYATVQPPILVHPARLYWVASAPSEMERRLRFVHAPGKPIKILEARSTCPAVTVELQNIETTSTETDKIAQEVIVHLPPGNQAPDVDEVSIVITTDSANPAYRKIEVPIRVMRPKPPHRPS